MPRDFGLGTLSLDLDEADPDGDADQIFHLNAIAGLDVVIHHRFGPDAGDAHLAVGILDVGEVHVPRHLAVDAHGLDALEDPVARALQHAGRTISRPSVVSAFRRSRRAVAPNTESS